MDNFGKKLQNFCANKSYYSCFTCFSKCLS